MLSRTVSAVFLIALVLAAPLSAQSSIDVTGLTGVSIFAHGGAFLSIPSGGIVGIGAGKDINGVNVFVDTSFARGVDQQLTAGVTKALPIDVKFGKHLEFKPFGLVAYGVDARELLKVKALSQVGSAAFLQEYGGGVRIVTRGHWWFDLGLKYSHTAGFGGGRYPFGLFGYTF